MADGAALIRKAVDLCYAPLLRYAISLSKNESLARDAVQESFLRLMNEIKKREVKHPKAWLFAVCRNRIFDEFKRSKRYENVGESCDFPGSDNYGARLRPDKNAEISDGADRAEMLTQKLSPKERELVRLKFQCGFSYAQMAEIMSLTPSNVGATLHNAVKNLRTMFFEGEKVNR